jgi:uncharacterized repeat protein (TIGR03803 family)
MGAHVCHGASPGLTAIVSLTQATGDQPIAAVLADNVVGRRGVFYTTTSNGAGTCYGTHGCGSIVQLVPPTTAGGAWTLNVLHAFTGPDGSVPYAGLMMDSAGALYGTATRGGAASGCTEPDGCGTVFRLTPPSTPGGTWTFTTLYDFDGGIGGRTPNDNPIFDSFGALYGTTGAGGVGNAGVVYKLTPRQAQGRGSSETVLHNFNGHDGARPRGNLIFDTSGALYGTTQTGGTSNLGTVFKLTPPATPGGPWTETVLHAFSGADGAQPINALLLDSAGALYGTTWKGGTHHDAGVVFKLTPPATPGGSWTESAYQMLNGADGATMQGGLTRDTFGVLYGTTNRGGPGDCALGHCGTVFKIVPPSASGGSWTHTVLADFTGPNGGNPVASPSLFLGDLYGTAEYGGAANSGVVFQVQP